MSTRQDCALALASLGFRIFPLRSGTKEPYRNEGWKAIMSSNHARIKQWFVERPDMNYAVVCDEHHVILDPDEGMTKAGRKKEGISNFMHAEELALGFVDAGDSIFYHTLRVRTPKGGVHLYFIAKRGYSNSASTVIADVDVRGPDGYVVGPMCWTADAPEDNTVEGTYEIESEEFELAEVPEWLEKLLDQGGLVGQRAKNAGTLAGPVDLPASIEKACRVLSTRRAALEGETGDTHTLITAQNIGDEGISEEKCLELMFGKILFPPNKEYPEGRTWNEMCEPPWTFEDLKVKVANAYRYRNKQVGAKMDLLSADGEYVPPPAVDGMDAMQATLPDLKPGEQYSAISQPIGKSDNARRIDSNLFKGRDFLDRKVYVESIIAEWFLASGVTAILAKRGTGKSVFLEDFALCVTTDTPWNGIQPAADWACIYLCGEDDTGLQRNLKAWKRAHNGLFPTDDRFMVASAVPNLMDAEDVKAWAEALKIRFKGRKVIVIVDTWQRATSNASQNDDKEMQKAIHQAEGLARYLDGCAIIAFHPPKGRDDTISGSMIMENSTTCIIAITSTGGTERHAEVMRIKGPGEGHYAKFNITSHLCDMQDKHGNELTGALPVYKGGNTEAPGHTAMDKEEAIRKVICVGLRDILTEEDRQKKGVSYREVAQWIIKQINMDAEGEIAVYFNRVRQEQEIMRLLTLLFVVGVKTTVGDGMVVKPNKGSLVIGDII